MNTTLCDCGPEWRTYNADDHEYCSLAHGYDFAKCCMCGRAATVIDGEPFCNRHFNNTNEEA